MFVSKGTFSTSIVANEFRPVVQEGRLSRPTSERQAVGTSGRVEAPGFILTKIMKPTGSAGPASAAPAPTTYRLEADDSKLSEHVGQKVEITGMLAGRPADRDASKGGISSAPQLKVENVKMIAATCTE